MNKLYFLLGSNLGEPLVQIKKAKEYLSGRVGKLIAQSSLYHTAAWGKTDQPDFINQALYIKTNLPAKKALEEALYIEKLMGRERSEKYAPRLIDIDILFYDAEIIHSEALRVPHPAIQLRKFALVPLNEIAPTLLHPVLKKTITQLLSECPDHSLVKRF